MVVSQERRKVLFYLRPGLNASEQYADAKIENHPLRDRSDMARTAMLAGLALGEVDSRLPLMLATLLSGENRQEVIRKMLISFLEISPDVPGVQGENVSPPEHVEETTARSTSAQNLANFLPE
ncbi:stable plasmid inheritance protein [Escherichia coli M056]|nr:stable plasmid inheritance protein [Escherichia coli M056]